MKVRGRNDLGQQLHDGDGVGDDDVREAVSGLVWSSGCKGSWLDRGLTQGGPIDPRLLPATAASPALTCLLLLHPLFSLAAPPRLLPCLLLTLAPINLSWNNL